MTAALVLIAAILVVAVWYLAEIRGELELYNDRVFEQWYRDKNSRRKPRA